MSTRRLTRLLLLSTLLAGWDLVPALEAKIRIRLGSVAPRDSAWHGALLRIRQEWREISGGEVDVVVIPGGQLGDGPEMVRKVRLGIIQAVALSQVGLSRIDKGVACLHIPMMLESYEELDYVRERIAPRLERRLEEQGFKVLTWGDAGWVHFFSTTPARTPDDMRKMKLFTSAGDPDGEKLWKEFGFRVIPLSLTDMLTSLQTGLINAFHVPPLFALIDGSYKLAKNMIDLKFSPVVGGTVISRRAWNRIPEAYQPRMLEAARAAGDKLRDEIRRLGPDSIKEMQKRGLQVAKLNEQELALWQAEAERAYPKLKGRYVPVDLFDEVKRLSDEFRNARAGE